MQHKEYNGYYNYETWAVSLWIDNDQYLQRTFASIAETASISDLEDELENFVEENNPLSDTNDMYSDLLNAAISECNFRELAENMYEEYHIEDTGEIEA